MGATEIETVAGVMDDLARQGFTEHFTATPEGLRAVEIGKTFRADQVTVVEYHRFEGVSDPGDMAIVYAIEAGGSVRGTLTDAFGVYADPRVGAVVREVALRTNSPIPSTAR